MRADLTSYDGTFKGKRIAFHLYRGRVCVIAAAVGGALGYADHGKSLVEVIRKHWADEMIHGRDFDVLSGEQLREFLAVARATDERSVAKVRHAMILYESGVDLVCIKTEKPAGRAMRRWLADEVLPTLRRGEQPGGRVEVAREPFHSSSPPDIAESRDAISLSLSDHLCSAIRAGELDEARLANSALAILLGTPLPEKNAPVNPRRTRIPTPRGAEGEREAGLPPRPPGSPPLTMGAQMLKAWREAQHFTTVEAARALGVAQAVYWGWENGKRTPRIEGLLAIQKTTSIPVAAFLQPKSAD